MGRLTTHVLDRAKGCPAAGIRIELHRFGNGHDDMVAEAVTNADGRQLDSRPVFNLRNHFT